MMFFDPELRSLSLSLSLSLRFWILILDTLARSKRLGQI